MIQKHKKLCDKHSENNVGEPKLALLRNAKVAQPSDVSSFEETNQIEVINREKLAKKMKDPKCIANRIIVKPHDYYEENRLTVFAPQKKLTPE